MRKIILIFCFLSNILFARIITLASFNIERYGDKEKDNKSIAKIISKFDIIAIQEVMNEQALKDLMYDLNDEYDYIISKAVGTDKYKEHFAVVYKKSKVDHIENLGLYDDKKDDFIREPSAFYIKSNKLSFILIPVHSIYGKDERKRAYEASKYVDVYEYFKNKNIDDDIIILGDFNLNSDDIAFKKLKDELYISVLDPKVDRTTISKKGLANSYDNIFIQIDKLSAFTKRYGVYDFTLNNHELIRKYISDHLLIFIELDNDKD